MLLAAQQQSHGPPHGLVIAIVVIAVVGWLVCRAVAARRGSADRHDSHPGSALAPSASGSADRDGPSDR